jgi:hypothetical protein
MVIMTTAIKGRSIVDIAKELERVNKTAQDFKVAPAILKMNHHGNILIGERSNLKTFAPTSWAHQQIASYLDIPKAYYDKLESSDKNLLAQNVNHWMNEKPQDDRRLLRTVDGKLRGLLSPRYRRLDSYDLINVVFPILQKNNFQVVSAEYTEKRLYIKATLPSLRADIKVGDTMQYGVMVSTSDVGAGSLRIEPYNLRLACMNGMVTQSALKKYHVGREVGGDEMMEVLSDETLNADDDAFWLKVRDVLLDSIRPETFQREVDKMKEAAHRPIANLNLIEVVKKATTRAGITSKIIREDIVAALASGNQGAGLTQWGLVNSFTAAAKAESLSYDDSVDLERAGGNLLVLSHNEWKEIAA